MKASFKLLRELIDFEWNVQQLAEKLTLSGSEVEAIEYPADRIENIVSAKILDFQKDTPRAGLSLCTITDGEKKYTTISGAPDIEVGLVVPFVRPGGKIFGGKIINSIEIEGTKSEGMICSGVEVGLGFPKDRLLHLPQDTPLGKDLSEILGWDDEAIYELEITPNRPDCYGHWGLAREIAALLGKPWEPEILRPKNLIDDDGGIRVEIETKNCPRYTGRLVSNVKVKPSPMWLQGRLAALGMRPLDNIVDITNYVMMLTGQPIHAFDRKKLGDRIIVRQAKDGEIMRTLDGVERKLNSEVMLIATPNEPVAIAGIMGGQNSEVDENTRDIVIEVAYFDPINVRRSKKFLGLATESATRFERGVDPNVSAAVSDIVAAMTEQFADAETVHKIVDVYPQPIEPTIVTLTDSKVERLLGAEIPRETSRKILVCLGLDIAAENAGGVTYRIPTFRPDLTREVDLVEEVGRIYGLNNIEPFFRAQGEIPADIPQDIKFRHFLEDFLAGMGYRYAFTDPLGAKNLFEKFTSDKLVELKNPLSDDLSTMRPNPLPTLVAAVARNINRGFRSAKLFEIDNGYKIGDDGYSEKMYLALSCGGFRYPLGWDYPDTQLDFFDIKGDVETILNKLGMKFEFKNSEINFAEKETGFDIFADGERIGFIGTLSKKLWELYELKRNIHFALLEFDRLIPYFERTRKYEKFSRYPAVRRDIALIVDNDLPASEILNESKKLAPDAEYIGFFDMYRGKPIPEDKKSLGLYFVFRSAEKTLTDDEVNERFTNIVKKLCEKFNAEIRNR